MPLSYSSYKEGYSSDSSSIGSRHQQQLASSVYVNNNLTNYIKAQFMQIVRKINGIERKILENFKNQQ